MIASFRGRAPVIDPSAYVGDSAIVVGDVTIGSGTSLWFHAVARGDVFPIRIGDRTNVPDHATIHVLGGRAPATIGDECLIGAGAVVTPGTRIAPGQLVLGSPARAIRPLTTAERTSLVTSAVNYARVAAEYRAAGLR